MKRFYKNLIVIAFIFSFLFNYSLYYFNFLEDYCFDTSDCRVVLFINVLFNFIKFAFFNLVWLLINPKNINTKGIEIIILASNIIFNITGLFSMSNSFYYIPLNIVLIIYYFIFIYKNQVIQSIFIIIIQNILILITLLLSYLLIDETIFGIPYSINEMKLSSDRLFVFFIYISILIILNITFQLIYKKLKP